MATHQLHFIRQKSYLAVSLTHFFVDILNSGRNLLVAILAINLGLSNAQVGIALLLYNVGSSMSQPLFGWLADRIGPRWLVLGGMGWMMLFYGAAAVAGDWLALIALTMAGIGSGAFHPTGTMVASQASVAHRTRATALFFMAGQLGLFSGPILTGLLLRHYGRPAYLALPALSFLAFFGGWQWLVDHGEHRHPAITAATGKSSSVSERPANFTRCAILLGAILLAYSTVGIAAMSFAPKLFTEMGFPADYVGWLSGLFMMGSAIGGVTGGTLADRTNPKSVILIGLLASILPVYFYIPAPGAWRFLLLLAAGFFSGMPHSILVIMVQGLFPKRQALASGLALGFMFFSGSLGSYILGVVADQIGLALALQWTAVLPAIAASATLFLPRATSVPAAAH